MFLCWENGIGFCWLLPYFSSVFQTPFLWVASCSWSRQIASHFDFLFQPCWLFINGSLVWPGLIGLASLVHFLIGSFSLASFALASLAQSLIGSLAPWLIGASFAHWLICAIFGIFRAFQLSPQDLRASGLFNLKLLVLELRFWLVKRSLFPGTFQPFNKASRASATFSDFICSALSCLFKGKRWFRFAKERGFIGCISLFR